MARTAVPMRQGQLRGAPTPEQLIGFPTPEEAAEAQRFLFTAPMERVEERMESYAERVKRGELAYIRPRRPDPPTKGLTGWSIIPRDARQLHETASGSLRDTAKPPKIAQIQAQQWLGSASNGLGRADVKVRADWMEDEC